MSQEKEIAGEPEQEYKAVELVVVALELLEQMQRERQELPGVQVLPQASRGQALLMLAVVVVVAVQPEVLHLKEELVVAVMALLMI